MRLLDMPCRTCGSMVEGHSCITELYELKRKEAELAAKEAKVNDLYGAIISYISAYNHSESVGLYAAKLREAIRKIIE